MIEVRNLQWDNAEHTSFSGELNHPEYGWIPYGFGPNDDGIGAEIWANRDSYEIAEYVEVVIPIEIKRPQALDRLNAEFELAKEKAYVVSSLGFTADANSTAKENVQGLIEEVGTGTVQFCDYYNQFHELNKSQLETLKSEINRNGQALYAQKWEYRTAIEECTDSTVLDGIIGGLNFTYMNFTQTESEAGTTETDQPTDGATE